MLSTTVSRNIVNNASFPRKHGARKINLKGPRKRRNIVAETLLRTQMFPCLRAHATFVADAKFASEMQKMFLNFFRNILRPQQMFPQMFLGLRGKEAKHLFCFPLVCSPWKHYAATMFPQQCFLVCGGLYAKRCKWLKWTLTARTA